MFVYVKASNIYTEIGTPDFFHSFFSTISFHLEKDGWGSRFPTMMNQLYQGALPTASADQAFREMQTIKEELANFSPDQVIWDIEDLSASVPWGDDISEKTTDLSNYFVTSTSRDLVDTMLEILEYARDGGHDVTVTQQIG